jgi:hypothetical protein
MTDKLIIVEDRYNYRIAWYLAEDQDIGANLGDPLFEKSALANCKPDEWDQIMATLVASESDEVKSDDLGYYWESKKQALITLKLIKVALKNKFGKPLPHWAVQAQAAGWKPPTGWTP